MISLLNRVIVFFVGFMPRFLVRRFAGRYIAGDRLEDAVALVKELNAQGIEATIDVLGEGITELSQAKTAVDEYKRVLKAIQEHKLNANISLKPTQFGLALDIKSARDNIREVIVEAAKYDTFVRIDMEDTPFTSTTFELYESFRAEFPRVGVVMQAYLRRSLDDLQSMLAEKGNGAEKSTVTDKSNFSPCNFRLCKGIYVEPRVLAYKDPYLINQNFTLLLDEMLKGGAYVGIATHDEKLFWEGIRLTRKYGLSREQYEFQMLLGVDKELRDIIVKSGHRLRIYIPYGTSWYPYSMRRLKENPQIAMHIVKNFFAGL